MSEKKIKKKLECREQIGFIAGSIDHRIYCAWPNGSIQKIIILIYKPIWNLGLWGNKTVTQSIILIKPSMQRVLDYWYLNFTDLQ